MIIAELPRRYRHPVRIIHGAVLAGLVAYAVLIVSRPDPSWGSGFESLLSGIIGFGAAFGCLLRGVVVRGQRLAWLVMGAGLLCSAAGDLIWSAWIRFLDPVPAVSVADGVWLVFYPCAYVTLMLLVRSSAVRFQASVWLDGIVGGLGAAAVGAALTFRTIQDGAAGTRFEIAVNLAYPLADLLLLMLVVGVLAMLGWRLDRGWWLLAVGMVGYAAADTIYLFQLAAGSYRPGTWLELLWPAAAAVFSFAAWAAPAPQPALRMERWVALMVPALFTLSGLAVLVGDHFIPMATVAVLLATGCLLAAVVRATVTFREVRALAESRQEARTDDLTGLANRRMLYLRMDAALADRSGDGRMALLLLDLDRFKEINDALGHHVGDRLLCEVGLRLRSRLRTGDLLARLGGDEFAILVRGADTAAAEEVADRLLAALDEPFDLDEITVHADASIGIAVCPDHATGRTTLLQRADVAMYHAKATRTGRQVYAADHDGTSVDRLQLIEDLRLAVTGHQLELHYQPQVDLATGAVTGVEALVRWPHPTQGMLYPDLFLPLAEATGLMRALTSVVLRAALRQLRDWRAAGTDLSVAVNLSVANLVDAHLPTEVADLLAEYDLPAHRLELEITEGTLMVDTQRSREMLATLRDLGVSLAVDDYGTGYSSLAYLRHLPVDVLKLDKSFVMAMTSDPKAAAIVESTIDLAHRLGLRVVAEGVESAAHLGELERAGCDIAQGYHISRPKPAADVVAWLAARPGGTPARRPAVLLPVATELGFSPAG